MKNTMTTNEVARELLNDDNADWSYNGAVALAEYLESFEEDTGQEIEFDRVAIRCDFSEYETALECVRNYDFEADPDDEDDQEEAALDYLREHTSVIEFEGGIIIQDW